MLFKKNSLEKFLQNKKFLKNDTKNKLLIILKSNLVPGRPESNKFSLTKLTITFLKNIKFVLNGTNKIFSFSVFKKFEKSFDNKQQKNLFFKFELSKKCPRLELNQRPLGFQPNALPLSYLNKPAGWVQTQPTFL